MRSDSKRLTTADHVEIDVELAGIGSRALAGMIDITLQVLVVIGLILAAPSGFLEGMGGEPILAALGVLLIFCLTWGYSTLFEVYCYGQSPGKWLAGIRVLTDDGRPVSWREAILRSLLRLVDFFSSLGFVGSLAILIDPNNKRIGDMVAGSIVVRCVDRHKGSKRSAAWVAELERGRGRKPLQLSHGTVSERQLLALERFLERRDSLPRKHRQALASKIAQQLMAAAGLGAGDLMSDQAENFLEGILAKATEASTLNNQAVDFAADKAETWARFETRMRKLAVSGSKPLKHLSADEMRSLLQEHRSVVSDLSRARAMNADQRTLGVLNGLARLGDQVINRYQKEDSPNEQISFFTRWPQCIRRNWKAVALASILFFVPLAITYVAVQIDQDLGYQLVPESFIDFQAASEGNMHDIPALARPLTASNIISNNIQVTFMALVGGVFAGLGTVLLLIYNGVFIGATGGWLHLQGSGAAFWGWCMPHGGTELLAIVIAGAAGLLLGDALLFPGFRSRVDALKHAAREAFTLMLGCAIMLLFAGLVEGFISPSSLGFPGRIAFLSATLIFWAAYFGLHGRQTATPFTNSTS